MTDEMTDEMLDRLEALSSHVVLRFADTEIAVVPVLVAEVKRLRKERDALQADILARSGFRTLWEIDHACVNNERDVALRILAALREPSNTILEVAWCECPGNFPADHIHVRDAIRAALAAAEREVANGHV